MFCYLKINSYICIIKIKIIMEKLSKLSDSFIEKLVSYNKIELNLVHDIINIFSNFKIKNTKIFINGKYYFLLSFELNTQIDECILFVSKTIDDTDDKIEQFYIGEISIANLIDISKLVLKENGIDYRS